MLTTILIMLLPALFILFSVLLYTHIKEKQLDKELLKLESELEQGRKKSSKELCKESADYHFKKSR